MFYHALRRQKLVLTARGWITLPFSFWITLTVYYVGRRANLTVIEKTVNLLQLKCLHAEDS